VLMREAEEALRNGYEAPSLIPHLDQLVGPMMVHSQAVLGLGRGKYKTPAMREAATRNLEGMVDMENLIPMHRGYLLSSAEHLGRPDLKLLIHRQALREKPESRGAKMDLAEAAIEVDHWGEAIELADEVLEERPTYKKAKELRQEAVQRVREWLAAEDEAATNPTEEDR